MTPARPPPELLELLKNVPNMYRLVLTGLTDISIYEEAQQVINKHRSDDFAEWDHLAQIIRQDQALWAAELRLS